MHLFQEVNLTPDQQETLLKSYLYLLDCELATLEYWEGLKKYPKSEVERHIRICRKWITDLHSIGFYDYGEATSRVQSFLLKHGLK